VLRKVIYLLLITNSNQKTKKDQPINLNTIPVASAVQIGISIDTKSTQPYAKVE
jgi:hypothetical protein